MYTAVTFRSLAIATTAAQLIPIRVRSREVVKALKARYSFSSANPAAVRGAHFAISRSKDHLTSLPGPAEFYSQNAVFFGVASWELLFATAVGINPGWNTMEADLRGVTVAGDLIACVRNDISSPGDFRVELMYELEEVTMVEKAMAMWRRETREQPN